MKILNFIVFLLIVTQTVVLSQGKTTGTSIAGLPSLSYSSGEGLEYGARLYFYHYGDGTISPYKWAWSTNISQTTRHRRDMFLFLDFPDVFGKDSRFDIYLDHKRFNYDDYFGMGNDHGYVRGYKEKDDPQYINEDYYSYQRKWYAVLAKLQFSLKVDGLKALTGFGYYDTEINTLEGVTRFANDIPFGHRGGVTNYLQFGLVFDRRDSESVPSKGCWSEVLVEKSIKQLGSDYHFWRITMADRRYFTLHPRLVYAQRIMYETMPGSPPFYEMGFFSSSYQRREGLGGGYSMRGLPRLFLLGPNKFLSNFELRLRAIHKRILKQDFTSYVHLFLDAGRVWLDEDKKEFSDLHITRGFGLHVRWNKDFVGSLDIGFSEYRSFAIYATFGNLF